MADLAKTLSMNYLGGQTVVDQTSLRGVYDFTLDCHTASMEHSESVLTVLPEQLGLELKPLDMLVIDRAEKPPGKLTADVGVGLLLGGGNRIVE